MKQNALSVIIPIIPNKLDELRPLLEGYGQDVVGNQELQFGRSPSTHFARFVILDKPKGVIARLYFSTCFDGELGNYLTEICGNLGNGMEKIWSCCEGYPANSEKQAPLFEEFINPFSHDSDVFVVAFPGQSAENIRSNIALRRKFEDELDSRPTDASSTSVPDESAVAKIPSSNSKFIEFLVNIVEYIVGIRNGAKPENTILSTDSALLDMEDRVVQNQMTIVSEVKKGFFPRWIMRIVLGVIRKSRSGNSRSLSGLTTIHFARWIVIDGGDNLLFESNFDGSWERYIDDFRDNAVHGLNTIWGGCVGFPKGGCRDIEAFKQIIRTQQVHAQYFYSAYPDATTDNIRANMALEQEPTGPSSQIAGVYV